MRTGCGINWGQVQFQMKDAYAIADLHWTLERYLSARALLVGADLIRFDNPTKTIVIRRWFKHNGAMNDSHLKGVVKVIQRIECEPFQQEAMEALQEAYEALKASKAPSPPNAPKNSSSDSPIAPMANISPAMRDNIARRGWDNTRGAA